MEAELILAEARLIRILAGLQRDDATFREAGKASNAAIRPIAVPHAFFERQMQMYRYVSLIIMAAFLSCASALGAPGEGSLINNLPHGFIGEFRWDGDATVQNVVIRFDQVRMLTDESAEATGCGAYEIGRHVTKIKVQMLVNRSDLRVQILERSPESSDNVTSGSFVTDGSHRGRLSRDLQEIDAQWTGAADGKRGRLHLRAAPSAVCAPATPL